MRSRGMPQQESMSLTDFLDKYGTEEKCRAYLYEKRWPDGFVCPKCGVAGQPFKITCRRLFQCRHCSRQTSVTAGTIFDKSRVPLSKWFLAIYLMSSDKRGCSALRLKGELGIAYGTAWAMSHKIRRAMKERGGGIRLSGYIELDEGFFGASSEGKGKRGRGTDKSPVLIGLSLDGKGRPKFIRAQVLGRVDGSSIASFAEAAAEPGSAVATDGLAAYSRLRGKGYRHMPEKAGHRPDSTHLRWLHVVISNLKAFIQGTYHGVQKKHLQAFIDEFCYRFNRRFWQGQLFARAVAAAAAARPFTLHELIG